MKTASDTNLPRSFVCYQLSTMTTVSSSLQMPWPYLLRYFFIHVSSHPSQILILHAGYAQNLIYDLYTTTPYLPQVPMPHANYFPSGHYSFYEASDTYIKPLISITLS